MLLEYQKNKKDFKQKNLDLNSFKHRTLLLLMNLWYKLNMLKNTLWNMIKSMGNNLRNFSRFHQLYTN